VPSPPLLGEEAELGEDDRLPRLVSLLPREVQRTLVVFVGERVVAVQRGDPPGCRAARRRTPGPTDRRARRTAALPLADQAFHPGTDRLREGGLATALADLVTDLEQAVRPALAEAV
jgi:hypothetical protein